MVALATVGRKEGMLLWQNQPPARNLTQNAASPTRRMHAVLGSEGIYFS